MILRFLAFLLLVYLVVYFLRSLFVKPFKQGYGGQGRRRPNAGPHTQQRKEGDVTISYDPRKQKGHSQGVGEYVDYEEVKD